MIFLLTVKGVEAQEGDQSLQKKKEKKTNFLEKKRCKFGSHWELIFYLQSVLFPNYDRMIVLNSWNEKLLKLKWKIKHQSEINYHW